MTHDAAYADNFAGQNNGTFYEQILDDFYNEIQPYAAYVPYMMSPGNHVCALLHFGPSSSSMLTCTQESIYDFVAYTSRVATSMPTNASGSDSPFWYSYDYGNVHFIAFSIEQPYNITDPQGMIQ